MERKLRVGFADIEDASSVASWSGTPFNVLQALRGNPDVEVELISPLKSTKKWLYMPHKLRSAMAKEVYDWRREEGSLRSFAAQIESRAREKALDVIFSTSSIPGTRLGPSVPFVFWTDAIFHALEGYYPGKYSKRSHRIGCVQEEAALRRADFACYSSHWAAEMASKLTSPECVKVLPFGPNLRIEHGRIDVEGWIRERREASSQNCNLLFVGVDWRHKGGSMAVETARHLNESCGLTTLKVIGFRPSESLPSFVEVIGFIDKSRPEGYGHLTAVYRDTDILILPSRAEYSAIVLAEAAAFGLPVLTCDTGGLADYVSNHKNGFRLPVEDGGTLFAERAKLILAAYEGFARNAYAEFEDRLNWDASVKQLVEILKRAAQPQVASEPAQLRQ